MRITIAIGLVIACGAIGGSLLRAQQTTTTTTGDRTTLSGVYTEAQAKRGEGMYAEKCSSCHGPELAGLDQAPSLTGGDFNTNWNDLALNDLFERIRISMPADKPGTLSRQEAADVVAFILQRGSFPAGQSELSSDAEALKGIKFLAKKP
jgi:S-disulfanyl-L-cysteine oxidoreductase SoxD